MSKPVLVCAMPVKKLFFHYLPTSCDAVELRLDYMEKLELNQELKNFIESYVSHYPTIVTVRERDEGGYYPVDPNIKYKVLEFSKGVGALLDIESSLLMKYPDRYGDLAEGSIVSRHVFNKDVKTYELALNDLELARRFRALIYKVFTVKDEEFVNLLNLLSTVKDMHIAVIPRNSMYRAVSIMMGTALMYCSTRGRTGPGQVNIGICSKVRTLRNSLLMYSTE